VIRRLLPLLALVSLAQGAQAGELDWLAKPKGTVPVIASFTANPTNLVRGVSSTLAWTVTGSTSLSIDQGVGDVTGTSSTSVSPTVTTTYTLTATNAKGDSTATATVTVLPYRIPESANVVAHVWWNGSSIQQTGSAFAMVGTVPQVAASGSVPAGAGPYSTANYYDAGNTLEQHASLSVCALVTLLSTTGPQALVTKDDAGTQRNFQLFHAGSGVATKTYVFKNSGSFANSSVTATLTTGVHLYCASYSYVTDGTSVLITQWDATQASITNGVGPPATTTAPLRIGANGAATPTSVCSGYVHEIILFSRALSSAELTAVYNSVHAGGAL
jgi:hypothetical protein